MLLALPAPHIETTNRGLSCEEPSSHLAPLPPTSKLSLQKVPLQALPTPHPPPFPHRLPPKPQVDPAPSQGGESGMVMSQGTAALEDSHSDDGCMSTMSGGSCGSLKCAVSHAALQRRRRPPHFAAQEEEEEEGDCALLQCRCIFLGLLVGSRQQVPPTPPLPGLHLGPGAAVCTGHASDPPGMSSPPHPLEVFWPPAHAGDLARPLAASPGWWWGSMLSPNLFAAV